MPKLAQFTMLDSDTGRTEKTEIVVGADHVMLIKPMGTANSMLYLSNGMEVKVLATVEQCFHKLVG